MDDKNAIDFSKKAILFSKTDFNKLVIAGNEKLSHFITKAIMFYILSEFSVDAVSECNIIGAL